MAQAHYVGGPLHGKIVEFGPDELGTEPGYRRYSETIELPHTSFSDFDVVILVHDSIYGYGDNLERAQEAVRAYWLSFVESEAPGNGDEHR